MIVRIGFRKHTLRLGHRHHGKKADEQQKESNKDAVLTLGHVTRQATKARKKQNFLDDFVEFRSGRSSMW
jgi:hypothetical protein